MEKRAIIFVILSLGILIGYQYLFPQAPPVQKVRDIQDGPAKVEGTRPATPPVKAQELFPAGTQPSGTIAPDAAERIITVETELFRAELSSRGGTLRSFHLKEYLDDEGQPLDLLKDTGGYRALAIGSDGDYGLSNQNFQVHGADLRLSGEDSKSSLAFSFEGEGVSVKRTYTFTSDSYAFELTDRVEGLPSYSVTLGSDLGIDDKASRYHHVGPVLLMDSDRDSFTPRKLKEPKVFTGNLKWIALEGKYFFSALVPREPMARADVWKQQDQPTIAFTGRPGEQSFLVYAGPKRRYELMELGVGLEHIVDFGFFSIIAVPIFWLLKQFYALTGNYGWAIIFLTIVIRVPFIPLVGKGQRSMKKMQSVQPLVLEIKNKYKNNPERMNQEVMGLYKKHKVNPLGGCLPLLLQLPVFFALYKVLLIAIELRGAAWLFWITDLSVKDPFYVLPVIMGGTMFLQQKMTPTAGDPKQQKILQWMPVIFTFMFLSFPSGLVLYWLINNLLAIGQQYFINKKPVPVLE